MGLGLATTNLYRQSWFRVSVRIRVRVRVRVRVKVRVRVRVRVSARVSLLWLGLEFRVGVRATSTDKVGFRLGPGPGQG